MSTITRKDSLYESLGLDPSKVTSHRDGTISYDGDVNWDNKTFKTFPLRFRRVTGYFSCGDCASLVSLAGAPQKVDYFSCRGCTSLISLAGAPQEALGNFSCEVCTSLLSLAGAPQEARDFYCGDCASLVSLAGAPQKVDYFSCENCTSLISLAGSLKSVDSIDLEGTPIYSIPEDLVIKGEVWLAGPDKYIPVAEARGILRDFKDSIKCSDDAGEILLDRLNRPLWQVQYASDFLNGNIQK